MTSSVALAAYGTAIPEQWLDDPRRGQEHGQEAAGSTVVA